MRSYGSTSIQLENLCLYLRPIYYALQTYLYL